MRRLLLSLLLASPLAWASPAPPAPVPLDVVELVNFTCPHCRHMDAYVPGLRKRVLATGGLYRMAPVGPVLDKEPAISVRFWYALDDIAGDAVADKAARYLYTGYTKGAALDSVAGIDAWLSNYMPGLPPISRLRKVTYSPLTKYQWEKALALFHYLKSRKVPAFLVLDADVYALAGTVQRDVSGNHDAEAINMSVENLITRTETPK